MSGNLIHVWCCHFCICNFQIEIPNTRIYTRKNLTCGRFVNKPSTSCLRTACHKLSTSLEQAVNNL